MEPKIIKSERIAGDLIALVRSGKNHDELIPDLDKISLIELAKMPDDSKKAFWINVYNAFNLILLEKFPGSLTKRSYRKKHFSREEILIACKKFNLDTIEHGILRRSKVKWALGLLANPFASGLEKKLRLKKMDFRIHFALNCGGLNCPSIRNYDHEKIDEQLELAEYAFFHQNESGSPDSATIHLSEIIKWYWFDFGGKKGVYNLIQKHGLSTVKKPIIRFQPYQW